MKKFFYVAVMALTMGLFASCGSGVSTGTKYAEDENPVINRVEHSVNGIVYDNTEEKCWELNFAISVPYAGKVTSTSYSWATEFSLIIAAETEVAQYNHDGIAAGYEYKSVEAENDDACYKLNSFVDDDDDE